MFLSPFVPCPTCGDTVRSDKAEEHDCDPQQVLSYRMFLLREEIAAFDRQFRRYTDTNPGRFAVWDAARQGRSP